MTVTEQVLAGLQQKFSGVDTAILSRIAAKKADGVTDEGKVNSIVEGIGFSDVLNYYGDYRAGDATKTAIVNYEKKHNLKDGKPVDDPGTPEPPKEDMAKMIADAIGLAVKPLSDKLEQFEMEKAQSARQEQIMAKAKEYGIPESQAKRYNIPTDADLDVYFKEVAQEYSNEGFASSKSPEQAGGVETDEESIAKMINEGTKSIVEQSNK